MPGGFTLERVEPARVLVTIRGVATPILVMNKPGAPDSRAPVSSDPQEFDKRFILVTADNIDETMRTYPQVFP